MSNHTTTRAVSRSVLHTTLAFTALQTFALIAGMHIKGGAILAACVLGVLVVALVTQFAGALRGANHVIERGMHAVATKPEGTNHE